jgi:spermidine/putrescine transport system permease protein
VAILFLVGAPLGLMGWVSLLEKGTIAGVDWTSAPSIGNYGAWSGKRISTARYCEHQLPGDLPAVGAAGGGHHGAVSGLGLPVALWMAGLSPTGRAVMLLLMTIPFWTNLLVRNYAWLIILREGGLAGPWRWTRSGPLARCSFCTMTSRWRSG